MLLSNLDPDHIAKLRRQLQAMTTQPAPMPWEKVAVHAIYGWMFGFAEKSDLLLIVSETGREVFDCLLGRSIVREEEDLAWHNWGMGLAFEGIGPLGGQIVRLAGFYGGGLHTLTVDCWQLYAIAPIWPDYRVILFPPEARTFSENNPAAYNLKICVQVEQLQDILAVGFSPTGRSFIIAQHHTLHVYTRSCLHLAR